MNYRDATMWREDVNPLERFVSSLPVAAVLSELLTALDCAPQVF